MENRFILFIIGCIGIIGVQLCQAETIPTSRAAPEPATTALHPNQYAAPHEIIATANPAASRAGAAILAVGGSAADAAIAAQLVLNLVEPQSSGLGGGAFVLYYDQSRQTLTSFDARETAPASANAAWFLKPDGTSMDFVDAILSGHSTGIPGVPRLLETLHARYGKLPWAKLIAPAMDLAISGYPVSDRLHALLARDQILARDPAARQIFYDANGAPVAAGSVIKNPVFVETLKALAIDHGASFYTGNIARDIIAAVNEATLPGKMTGDDFAAYRVIERPPVCGVYRTNRVCGMGPPSAGGVVLLQILAMMQTVDMGQQAKLLSPEWAMHFGKANQLAYADRNAYIADPGFVAQPVAALLNPDYLAIRASLVAMPGPLAEITAGSLADAPGWQAGTAIEPPSTSHISVVDRDGNAVSMTSSIEGVFGAHRMVDGFFLNNQLTDFSFLPQQNDHQIANRVEAGKRPRSAMAPTIVFNARGKISVVIGSAGGRRIIGNVAEALLGALDFGLPPGDALALPHINSDGETLELESDGKAADLADPLRQAGFNVRVTPINTGLTMLARHGKEWLGAADPRREGIAAGD